MFSNIGTGEIIIVILVLILLFGGKKLPELARGLGESGKELKKAKKEIEKALTDISKEETFEDTPSQEGNKKGGEPR
jgi:sec-independent protein translocase protein TatA